MISLNEIKKFYPVQLHRFDRGLLREYLQYLILSIIFSHPLGRKLSFLGGTCLRIVYGTQRFSEDIDFDNKKLSQQEFLQLSEFVKSELAKFGYEVEISTVSKLAFHCKIKFPTLLNKLELSGISSEKILIQVDTFDQAVDYETETYILNRFDITKPIIVTPKAVILSQKLWTIVNRKNPKGRDFYDIVFLLQNTIPDQRFLEAKFNTSSSLDIKQQILQHISGIDFKKIAEDVSPFLSNKEDINKVLLFREIFERYTF